MWDYKAFSDNQLFSLLKESDHAAYTEIYNRYFFLLYTHAYKKLRDEEQAKDVLQEIFATLWFKREFLTINTTLSGYLYMAVRNKVFDLFAHEQVKSKYQESLNNYLTKERSAATDHRIRERQMQAYINREIAALPTKMRQVFEMSRNDQLSHREIATILHITENNVSKQINNALRILKTKLGIFIIIVYLVNR